MVWVVEQVYLSPLSLSLARSLSRFPVGTYNTVILCDKSGWAHCKQRISSGSLYSISWTLDGTQFAAGGGDGSVCFCQAVGESLESGKVRVTLVKPKR